MNQKAKDIQNMFDAISPRYDMLNRVLSFRRDVGWRKKTVRRLKLADKAKVLDLACGTGDMILTLQATQPSADITGADFSTQMLAQGRKKVNVPLVAADACMLPFEDKSFDLITMVFGFRNVTDKPKALAEMRRVLKDGGRICILEFSKPKSKIFSAFYWFYFKTILPLVGRLVSKHKDAYTYLPDSVENFPSEDEYRRMILDAGFGEPAFKPYDFGICTATTAAKS